MVDEPTPSGVSASTASASGDTVLRLRLIGRMEAWTYRSENVLPTRRKSRAMLACIAMASPRPVLRSRITELLWSQRRLEQGRGSLRQEIYRVLEALAPAETEIVLVTRDHLSLRPGVLWIDVKEALRATSAQPEPLALLEAELLEDLNGVDPALDLWLRHERELLRDWASSICEAWLARTPDPDEAIVAAQRLLKINPTHEGGWRALMRAHAERGQRGLAVQAYERCRSVLGEVLDAVPSADTQKLLGELKGSSRRRLPLKDAPQSLSAAVQEQPHATHLSQHAVHGGARVGVLPLRHVGVSPEDSYLGPGLADEISTALSKFRWLFVVSSNSLSRFSGDKRDDSTIRLEFGLDFLIDGSVVRAEETVRIHLRLLDLRSASQVVWARRFASPIKHLLALQDEIAATVVAQIDPEILFIEVRRIASQPPVDPTAYDLMLRGIQLMRSLERGPFEQAGQYLEDAIALDPGYAAAYSWYAYWHMFMVGQDWTTQPRAEIMQRAGSLADHAVRIDPFDARGLSIRGHVTAFLHHRLDEAMLLHERALMLNPNLPMAWALSAVAHAYAGDPEEAERRNNRYKKLSPLDPHAFFFDGFFMLIHLMKRDYEKAADEGRKVIQLNPEFIANYKPYLAALGYLGRTHETEEIRTRLLAMEPGFTVDRFLEATPMEKEVDRIHYAEGLRRAGICYAERPPDSRKPPPKKRAIGPALLP